MASAAKRLLLAGSVVAALIAVVSAFYFAGSFWSRRESKTIEIGVLFPGAGSGDLSFANFLAAVRIAAEPLGIEPVEQESGQSVLVGLKPNAVRFRWYPEVGSRGIQRRVCKLCEQPIPPLALIGANNSSMTYALARELGKCTNRDKTPLLLMTDSTADGLIDVNPGRSFRFGFNNSHQARMVVQRLQEYYASRGIKADAPRAALIQVLDDPFTVDIVQRFEAELRQSLGANIVRSEQQAALASPTMPTIESAPNAWPLSTSTGGYDDPSQEESQLARQLVERMLAEPEQQWILVLPVGTTQFRRFAFALQHSLAEQGDRARAEQAAKNLVILAGDSMNYYSFADAALNQLLPEETPAPVILFAHVNPIDRSIAESPHRNIPAQALDRDVLKTLFAVLPKLGDDPSPATLASALANVETADGEPLFSGGERQIGGGAIIVVPNRSMGRFELLLPEEWSEAP